MADSFLRGGVLVPNKLFLIAVLLSMELSSPSIQKFRII